MTFKQAQHERQEDFWRHRQVESSYALETAELRLDLIVNDDQMALFTVGAVHKIPLCQRVVEERKAA